MHVPICSLPNTLCKSADKAVCALSNIRAPTPGLQSRKETIATRSTPAQSLSKLATGIEGFDQLSRGGLPRHRTSLLLGGPGAGKTVFALQCLVNAVRRNRAPGIFVAFEESPRQIIANGATFDWELASLAEKKLFFLDAHLSPTLVKAGDFDLAGMLAMLTAKKNEIGAQWIVFDGIDVLLTLLQDPLAEMREIYRIRDWLADNALTAIVTAKLEHHGSVAAALRLPAVHGRLRGAVRAAPGGPRLHAEHPDHEIPRVGLRGSRVPGELRALGHRGGRHRTR